MPDTETIDDLSHRRIRPNPDDERIPAGIVIAALRDRRWVDAGGGRFVKAVVVSGKSFSCAVTACQACRREHFADFVLADAVWRAAAGAYTDGLLCLPCAGGRLGRAFRPDDFPDVPINRNVRFLLGAVK